MRDLGDHAAGRRRVRHLGDTPEAIEPKPDQGFTLAMVTPDRAADLFDFDHFSAPGFCTLGHHRLPANARMCQSAACSASPRSRRRPCRVDTLMLRRAATERGESWCLSASKVARTML